MLDELGEPGHRKVEEPERHRTEPDQRELSARGDTARSDPAIVPIIGAPWQPLQRAGRVPARPRWRNYRIQVFTRPGGFLAHWGVQGTEPGQFDLPFGVAVDGSDNVFVADTWNHRAAPGSADFGWSGGFSRSTSFGAPMRTAIMTL